MSSRYLIPLAVAAALAAPVANAWELDAYPGQPKGDWIFRLGLTQVNPTDQTLKISAPGDTPQYIVADSDVSVSGTVAYMITDHIATELLLAYPFTHGLDLKGDGANDTRIGYVDQLPPTLSVQWHFNPTGVFRPYVGVGLNWTLFGGEELRGNAKSAFEDAGIYNAKLSMDDSFGAAAQIGADIRTGEHWLVNFDVRYIGISSKTTLTGRDGEGARIRQNLGDADINPMVYTVAVGYQWGAPAKPVVAPPPPHPPPPPPPPPAKCSDSDGDGVCDVDDKCPNTPAGTKVDKVGCPLEQTLMVNFAFDSSELTPESITELERVVTFMNDVSFATARIEGYTDSKGTKEYNLALSDRRAKAVLDYLTSRGVNPDRLTWKGFGMENPIAPNTIDGKDNPEGRAKNRRVMLIRTDSGG